MGFYNDVILPRLCHLVMRNRRLVPYRERVIASAEGRVLEIGIGSGLNLPFYGPHVREIVGLEPAPRLIAMARQAAERIPMLVTFMEESAAAIPLIVGCAHLIVANAASSLHATTLAGKLKPI